MRKRLKLSVALSLAVMMVFSMMGGVAADDAEELKVLTAVSLVDSQTQNRIVNAIGETIQENRWNDLIAEELGYQMEYIWVVNTQEQYDQKFNTSIAAGDIPDIVRLSKVQFGQCVEAGLLAEMGPLFDEYANDLLKQIIADGGYQPIAAATYQGKQYALPVVDADIERGGVVWIRDDWREALGIDVPKTIDELVDMLRAFNEHVGEGAVGLPIRKELFGTNSNYSINLFCHTYGAYPEYWIERDGKLVYGSIVPEMKQALAKLNELYNEGLIDPEFIVKDEAKVHESIAGGKAGFFYGAHWSSLSGINDSVVQDENAVWNPYHLPSLTEDEPVKVGIQMATGTWFASSINNKYPEAVIQLANLYVDKTFDPEKQEYVKYSNPGGDVEGLWKYSPVYMMTPLKNIDTTRAIRPYLEANDPTGGGVLYGEQLTMLQYALIGQAREERNMIGWDRVFGIGGSCQIQDEQLQAGAILRDEFYGAPTETMATHQSILKSAFDAEIVKIITGQSPIDAFDAAVEAWLVGGGQQITDEVNAWYESVKQ